MFFFRLVYNVAIRVYGMFISIAAISSEKAKNWVEGRQQQKIVPEKDGTVWFHCASLGEYEQAKPLMIAIRKERPTERIVLTFFSPSGYSIRKNTALADVVYYLPLDTPKLASAFIEAIRPSLVFFVKYEFWFNFLRILKRREVPTYLVAGVFRKNQHFFGIFGFFFREVLTCFDHLFVQDSNSKKLLSTVAIENVSVTGDTRFDTVVDTKLRSASIPIVEEFMGEELCVVVGSSWVQDERLLVKCLAELSNYKIVIAPHELGGQRMASLRSFFPNMVKYSEYQSGDRGARILVMDNMGMLGSLYRYASWAYIGGGFGVSIHNVLEAAVYGIPVVFGPAYHKSLEAKELLELGAAYTIKNAEEMLMVIQNLKDADKLAGAGGAAGEYVRRNAGSTASILAALKL